MQVFNAKSQKHEAVKWSVDHNGELICEFKDGHFLKFPAGTTKKELHNLLATHEEANKGQEIITPEAEAKAKADREKSESLVAELNDAEPKKG
jgi:hypothetical protein